MRKISLIIVLALCITIGGVYAAWTYSETTKITDGNATKALQMADVVNGGTSGVFSVNTENLVLTIDDTNGDHYPELVGSGTVTVTFTPGMGATNDIKTNGVKAYTSLSVSNNDWTFADGHGTTGQILTIADDATHTIARADAANAAFKWVKQNDGTFTCTFEGANIAQHIQLNQYLLDSYDLYQEYEIALRNGQIVFTVTDTQQ